MSVQNYNAERIQNCKQKQQTLILIIFPLNNKFQNFHLPPVATDDRSV